MECFAIQVPKSVTVTHVARSDRKRLPPLTERPASPEELGELVPVQRSCHMRPHQGHRSQPQSVLSTGVVARRRPDLNGKGHWCLWQMHVDAGNFLFDRPRVL